MAAAFLLAAASCACDRREEAVVSGKVAFQGMAIEGAAVRAVREKDGRPAVAAAARSGYHGAFVLRLPPGLYRVEAHARIPRGARSFVAAGAVDNVLVPAGGRRVGRVLVELRAPPRAPNAVD